VWNTDELQAGPCARVQRRASRVRSEQGLQSNLGDLRVAMTCQRLNEGFSNSVSTISTGRPRGVPATALLILILVPVLALRILIAPKGLVVCQLWGFGLVCMSEPDLKYCSRCQRMYVLTQHVTGCASSPYASASMHMIRISARARSLSLTCTNSP